MVERRGLRGQPGARRRGNSGIHGNHGNVARTTSGRYTSCPASLRALVSISRSSSGLARFGPTHSETLRAGGDATSRALSRLRGGGRGGTDDTQSSSRSFHQNVNRNASCINRGWFACVVTWPNVLCGRRRLRVRRAELHAVEQVERLGAQRQIHSAPDARRLAMARFQLLTPCPRKSGSVRAALPSCHRSRGSVDGSPATNAGVGHAETAGVEPLVQPIDRRSVDLLVAVRIDVRPQSVPRADQVGSRGECRAGSPPAAW